MKLRNLKSIDCLWANEINEGGRLVKTELFCSKVTWYMLVRLAPNCLPKLCTGKYVQRQSHYNVQSSNCLFNKKKSPFQLRHLSYKII